MVVPVCHGADGVDDAVAYGVADSGAELWKHASRAFPHGLFGLGIQCLVRVWSGSICKRAGPAVFPEAVLGDASADGGNGGVVSDGRLWGAQHRGVDAAFGRGICVCDPAHDGQSGRVRWLLAQSRQRGWGTARGIATRSTSTSIFNTTDGFCSCSLLWRWSGQANRDICPDSRCGGR